MSAPMARQTPEVCAAQGCLRPVARTLACAGHWYALPAELRSEILAAWKAYRASFTMPPRDRDGARARYSEARRRAYAVWGAA